MTAGRIDRYNDTKTKPSEAMNAEAPRIRDDVAFFQTVQAVLAKRAPGDARHEEETDHAVRQIISRAVASEGVVDLFAAAGRSSAGSYPRPPCRMSERSTTLTTTPTPMFPIADRTRECRG
jgi:hypothetical protein